MNRPLQQVVSGIGFFLAFLVLVYVIFGRPPFLEPVPDDAPRVAVGDSRVASDFVEPFHAEYDRYDRILGIPFADGVAMVRIDRQDPVPVQEADADPAPDATPSADAAPAPELAPATLDAVLFLQSNGVEDRMSFDASTLAPLQRSFAFPGGGGQSFVVSGARIEATVRVPGQADRVVELEYDAPVFEVSLLELPLAAMHLDVDDAGRIAWNNMVVPTDNWASFRVLDREAIDAAGRTWDTLVVRLAFADGRIRDVWIAREPPYKIRFISYQRGFLLSSGWELTAVESR